MSSNFNFKNCAPMPSGSNRCNRKKIKKPISDSCQVAKPNWHAPTKEQYQAYLRAPQASLMGENERPSKSASQRTNTNGHPIMAMPLKGSYNPFWEASQKVDAYFDHYGHFPRDCNGNEIC